MNRLGVFLRALPLFAALVSWPTLAACGGAGDAEPAPCEKLRDHVLDVSIADVAAADREQHRAALEASMDDFLATCAARLSNRQIACGLEAATPTVLSTCMTLHEGGR